VVYAGSYKSKNSFCPNLLHAELLCSVNMYIYMDNYLFKYRIYVYNIKIYCDVSYS